jgi:gas vesicle protein
MFLNIQIEQSFLFLNHIIMKLSKAAFLLLTGVALGMLAGLLYAPMEGAATRKKWMKKAKKFKKTVEDKASEYKDKAADLKDNIAGAANDLKKKFS